MSNEPRSSVLGSSRKRLFVLAAIWHITFASVIFLISRYQLLPQTFDTNGIGVSFAIDSRSYRIEAENLAQLLHQRRLRDWVNYNASFHVKVYSLSCAILGNLVGFNILAVEPVNLVCYLSILWLVYSIARETFDRNVARLATIFIGLWPSLVLHTTQMLRDVIFIPSMLLLVFGLLLSVTRPLSVKQGSLVAGAASFGTLLLWLCRGDMWEMVFLIVLIGAGICVLAQLKERRFGAGKTVAIMSILIIAFWIPSAISTYRQSNEVLALTAQRNRDGMVTGDSRLQKDNLFKMAPTSQAPWSKLAKRVGLLRHKFIIRYPLAGSNIDTDVELAGVADTVRYLPRATLIGLFSPFPNMWFTKGAQVGLTGRLVAGGEMVIMYSMFGLTVYALVLQWNRLSFWLLLSIALVGCTALGYVVVNVSSLYRMRYVFSMLLIILGTKGLLLLWPTGTALTVALSQENARVS